MENNIEKIYYDSVAGLNDDILKDKNAWYNYVSELPIQQQVVYTVVLFHSQVENGGFHQYFFNSYGQFAYLTLKNLKLISANKRSGLLENALREVNIEKIKEEEFRELIFNRKIKKLVEFDKQLVNQLDSLDNKYYELDNEDIDDLLQKYLNTL